MFLPPSMTLSSVVLLVGIFSLVDAFNYDVYRQRKDDVDNAVRQSGKNWRVDLHKTFKEQLGNDNFVTLLGAEEVSRKFTKNLRSPIKFDPPGTATKRALPLEYDARKGFKYCPSVASIRHQFRCSSCWAVGTTSVISDRHCAWTWVNRPQVYFSAMQAVSCLPKGCKGGTEWDVYEHWMKNGLVTGGTGYAPSNQPEGCIPYQANLAVTPTSCPTTCTNTAYNKTMEQDKFYGGDWYIYWSPSLEKIKYEIFNYASVTAFFTVYEDFYYYGGGVYEHVSGEFVGYHVVKLIGWGTENGTDYWLAANSWGTAWGDDGFFKIRRGTNEVGIESRITGAVPKEAYTPSTTTTATPAPTVPTTVATKGTTCSWSCS